MVLIMIGSNYINTLALHFLQEHSDQEEFQIISKIDTIKYVAGKWGGKFRFIKGEFVVDFKLRDDDKDGNPQYTEYIANTLAIPDYCSECVAKNMKKHFEGVPDIEERYHNNDEDIYYTNGTELQNTKMVYNVLITLRIIRSLKNPSKNPIISTTITPLKISDV